MRPRAIAALLLLFVAGCAFRIAVIASYRSTSPDGNQYYALSQQLVTAGRLAFAPPPAPLSYSRLPGYPVFLALVGGWSPITLQASVTRAAIANTLLDVTTALLVAFIVVELGRPLWNACVAFALVMLCPLLFLFASYQLTESLATFLGILAFALALRARRGGSLAWSAAAGAAIGAGLLVRADLLTEIPALLLLVWDHTASPSVRWRRVAAALAAIVVVVAPWAGRNLARFGAPHVFAAEWPAQDGEPLPTGPMQWMRTWAAGQPGDGDLSGLMVFKHKVDPQRSLLPRMYDSDDERRELVAILADYNRDGLSPSVNERFVALAAARRQHHPLRVLVELPLARAQRLYESPPPGDYPIRVNFLGLPKHRRALFATANAIVYVLALVGAVLLVRDAERRRVLLAIVVAVAGRTLLHMWAVPTYVCQRYLIEVVPLLLVLAAIALGSVERLRGARPTA